MSEAAPVLNAKAAIARHVQWRITLQLAITLREPLSAGHTEQIRHYRRMRKYLSGDHWHEPPAPDHDGDPPRWPGGTSA